MTKSELGFRNLTFWRKLDWQHLCTPVLLFHQSAKTLLFFNFISAVYTMMNAVPLHHPDAAEPNRSARAVVFNPEYGVPRKVSKKVVLPTMEGYCFEKVKNISYLEASGNYTLLHFTDKRQILVCRTLREVEQMLPERFFTRIHRSHSVNLKHIKRYIRGKGGHVVMQNGVNLVVSAGQKDSFMNALRQYFG
jgi:hypothetical protein